MAELLVSVRSAREAEAALRGGAALIDVKDPALGSLGRAADVTVTEVVRFIAGRKLVSAAMGELVERLPCFETSGLTYVKWGLAGCRRRAGWSHELAEIIKGLHQVNACCQPVAVAYADWRRADAPPPAEVCAFARAHPCRAWLLDTWRKDGSTLLDWLPLAEICRLSQGCRDAGARVALAGSLGAAQIALLRTAEPDWFAVRGAVCRGGRRDQAIDSGAVLRLADLVKGVSPAMGGN